MKEDLLKGLNEKQIEKIKACKNQEEILKVAKDEGIELNDEQLEAVSGGCGTTVRCPSCSSTEYDREWFFYSIPDSGYKYTCKKCGKVWYS